MPTRPDVTAAQIVEYVRRVYGIEARHVFPLVGGDAEATVYRVDGDQRPHLLKLRREQSANPPLLARHLADLGTSQVLAPLTPRDGRLSTRIGDLSALLYPFIDGEDAFRRPLNDDQWTVFGTVVKAVHDVKLPPSVSERMRQETYADGSRRRARSYLKAVPPGGPNDAVARELLDFLSDKRVEITTLIYHAEQLAASLRHKTLPMVPCHGDLHAGNVLVGRDGSLTIVDWDDPVIAPKERDLMFVGGGVGGLWNRPEEEAPFYRGYGQASVDAETLAYYRCERIVEDVASYCDQLLLECGDQGAERERSLRRLVDQFRPNDVVEIAERTFAAL